MMPWWVIAPTLWAAALIAFPAWLSSRRIRREGSRRGQSSRNGLWAHHHRPEADPEPVTVRDRVSRAPRPTIVTELNDILAEAGEPDTCLEELERAGIWAGDLDLARDLRRGK